MNFLTYRTWLKIFDVTLCLDVIYTDLAKTFDTVSHLKLIAVLQSYGVQCNVLGWIRDFLSDRVQSVSVYLLIILYVSSALHVSCGVPQGSV